MKLPILVAFLAISLPIFAQTVSSKQILCVDSATMIKSLTSEDIEEKLFWAAKSDTDDSKYALFVNSKNKKWTFIQLNEKMACILGTGDHATPAVEFQPIKK